MSEMQSSASIESTGPRIFLVHGQKVMLDEDLAAIYAVETDVLCRVVARSINRFPEGAVLHLSADERVALRRQLAKPEAVFTYVFTGQGVALLSSILLEEREARDSAEECAPTCSCRC